MSLSIANKTKGKLPRLPFVRMKDAVLGPDYDLSLVFVTDKESQKLNQEHRGKSYIPNVLSFELDKTSGEVFINPSEARRQAPSFDKTYSKFIGFLFIHALCHLKGMKHGSRMERTEKEFRESFGI
jgi:rRNA maturation RNase YbeY